MNPYQPPNSTIQNPDAPQDDNPGRPCLACGSTNTGSQDFARPRPNLLLVLLFGWIVLLIRGAFAVTTERCRDCGATRRYKSIGSWIALAVLLTIIAVIALVVFSEPE
jgi:hypothetical protein